MNHPINKTQVIEMLKQMEADGFLVSEWFKTKDNSFTKYYRLTR